METGTITDKIYLFLIGLSGFQAYAFILGVLFFCGLGAPIPEDITLFAAGFLAFKGQISLPGAILAGFVGVLVGDTFLYSIGRKFGRRVFDWPIFRRVFTPQRIALAEKRIQKKGRIICFTSRFLPGLRAPVFLTSGVMGIPFKVFFTMDALAAVISVPVWVLLAYHLGDGIEMLFKLARRANYAVSGIIVGLVVFYIVILKLQKKYQLWRQ